VGNLAGKGRQVSIDDFTAHDRERTLSLLLSQDRVVTLLYSKAFPHRWVLLFIQATVVLSLAASETHPVIQCCIQKPCD
jgi:hypothetical protein